METAEQNMHEARALYKRAIGRKLDENGQVDVPAVPHTRSILFTPASLQM